MLEPFTDISETRDGRAKLMPVWESAPKVHPGTCLTFKRAKCRPVLLSLISGKYPLRGPYSLPPSHSPPSMAAWLNGTPLIT